MGGISHNQGQITAFMVVGILILILTGVLVGMYISKERALPARDAITALPIEQLPIERFLKICLEDASEQGIALLSKQGGYIYSFSNVALYDQWQIAYHSIQGQDVAPTKQQMEQDLSRYIAESLLLCSRQRFLPLYENIEIKPPTITTAIEDTAVDITAAFPVTITTEESKVTIDTWYYVVPVRLPYLFGIKQDIVNTLHSTPDSLNLNSLTKYDVQVTLLQTDGETRIYSIKDPQSVLNEESVLVFNFAVQQTIAAPPTLSFIPNVIITVGQEYNMVARATDPDSATIQFSIKEGSGMIESDSGRYFFTPTAPGEYITTICASDETVGDCETFTITAQEQITIN